MSTRHTPHELAQHYTATMGLELGRQFYRLWNECGWLHLKWSEYVALFGTNKTRVDLLNKAAPGFTRLVEGVLWDDVLLHICRLTDEPTVARRDTLTIRRLPLLVTGTPIETQIKWLAHVADSKSRFARDWRNRHIAHRDLRLALKESVKPLARASRDKVREAITAIAAVLNGVETHYCEVAGTGYEFASLFGNGETLLHVVRDGLAYRDDRYERFKAGQPLPQDLTRKPPL